MKCPYCNYEDTKVTDSRATDDGNSIRRRRECVACQKRFTTYEMVEETPLSVVKRNGRREQFDRNKLLQGLLRSCDKSSISRITIEEIVNNVERQVRNELIGEIPTEKIGELVLEYLRDIDQVAYVRFASVYRKFDNVDSFMEELKYLKKLKTKKLRKEQSGGIKSND